MRLYRFTFWQLANPYPPYGWAKNLSLIFDDDPDTMQNITLRNRTGPQLWALVPVDAKKVNITFGTVHGWWHKYQNRVVAAKSDAITTAADGTCTAKLTSIGGGGLSHRNIIINGAMNVAQYGTSISNTGNIAGRSVDRFFCQNTGI